MHTGIHALSEIRTHDPARPQWPACCNLYSSESVSHSTHSDRRTMGTTSNHLLYTGYLGVEVDDVGVGAVDTAADDEVKMLKL